MSKSKRKSQKSYYFKTTASPVGRLKLVASGSPNAVRAVGAANGKNPLSIVAPCHRVIGSNGDLTGFAGGLQAKKFLLGMESRSATGNI